MSDNLKEVLGGKPISRRKVLKAGVKIVKGAGIVVGSTVLSGCGVNPAIKRDEYCEESNRMIKRETAVAGAIETEQAERTEAAKTSENEATRVAGIRTRETATAGNERESLENELKEKMLGKQLPEDANITILEDGRKFFSNGTTKHNIRSLPTTHKPCKIIGHYPCGKDSEIGFGYVATIEWDRDDGKGKHVEHWGTQSLNSGKWLCIEQKENMVNPPEAIIHFKVKK